MPDYALLVRTMDLKSNFTKGDLIFVDKEAFEFLRRVDLEKSAIILPNTEIVAKFTMLKRKCCRMNIAALAPNAILVRTSIRRSEIFKLCL